MSLPLHQISTDDLIRELQRRRDEIDAATKRAITWETRQGDTLKACAIAHGCSPGDLFRATRTMRVVMARWTAFEILSRQGFSLSEIGDLFGMHHTTVMYGRKKLAIELANPSSPFRPAFDAASAAVP